MADRDKLNQEAERKTEEKDKLQLINDETWKVIVWNTIQHALANWS